MNRMRDRLICGKEGLPFVNVTRPELIDTRDLETEYAYACPVGTRPCGGFDENVA